MAYNEELAHRIRKIFKGKNRISKKKMFGCLSFMLGGHMCCGVLNDDLVVRVGPDGYEHALAQRHVRPMDLNGGSLRGFVFVDPKGFATYDSLMTWIEMGIKFTPSLPPKKSI
ncbi:TfoX/Sxy family protein [Desulfobacterota bacterium AH_259_B03_O07]|nr:TfoX/Sxy family protein [Desulfobacterota bacterium AH_259_B03_O07]